MLNVASEVVTAERLVQVACVSTLVLSLCALLPLLLGTQASAFGARVLHTHRVGVCVLSLF